MMVQPVPRLCGHSRDRQRETEDNLYCDVDEAGRNSQSSAGQH